MDSTTTFQSVFFRGGSDESESAFPCGQRRATKGNLVPLPFATRTLAASEVNFVKVWTKRQPAVTRLEFKICNLDFVGQHLHGHEFGGRGPP